MSMVKVMDIARYGVYLLSIAAGAASAGFMAIEDGLPTWLVFTNAVLLALSGSLAAKNFTHHDPVG